MIEFYIKKFISFFIEPYGLIISTLVIGIYYLFKQKNKLAKIFIGLSTSLLLIFSYEPFANLIIKNLETKYKKYEYNQQIKYIHVLGNGNNKNHLQPISSYLSEAGIKRVLEGVFIYQNTPHSKLIFTGYAPNSNPIPAAQIYAEVAISLGVKKEDIIIGKKTKDTKEEAEFSKKIIGNEKLVLVTSASHMPRAITTFQSVGLDPIAAPTDFQSYITKGYLIAPNTQSMKMSELAIHEYIGTIWINLKIHLNN